MGFSVSTRSVAVLATLLTSVVLQAQQPVARFNPPADPQGVAVGLEEVSGTLEVLVEDRADGPLVHHFLDTPAGRLRLREAPGRADLAGLTTGSTIRARGRRAPDGVLELNGSTSGSSVTTMALASPNSFGQQRTVVILVNFQDDPSTPYAWTHAQDVTFNQTSNFFLENSYGQTWLTGDVFGWFTIPVSKAGCDHNVIASAADQAATAAGANLSNYTRRVYAFPSNGCSWWGLGSVGGNPSRAWVKGTYSLKVVAHELGHNFGDWHSNSQPCDGTGCTMKEYGDDRDMMGGTGTGHFHAYQKERLGWLNYGVSPSIQTVTTSGQFRIDSLSAAGAGVRALKILKAASSSGNIYYYVEARTQIGHDGRYAPGVQIHTGNDSNGNSATQIDLDPASSAFDALLDPGQSWVDSAAGLTVTTLSMDASGAWIRIDYAGVPCTRRAPTVTLSPGGTITAAPGTPVNFALSVRNNDDSWCAVDDFGVRMEIPAGWSWVGDRAFVTLAPGAIGSAAMTTTSTASANGTFSVRGLAERTTGPGGASPVTSLSVRQPVTSIGVSLHVSGGSQYTLTATVTGGNAPVSGAQVVFTVTDPNGARSTLSATTGTAGTAAVRFKPKPRSPKGTYQVSVSASWNSLTAATSGGFVY